MRLILSFLSIVLFSFSCGNNKSSTEIYQKHRDNILNVNDRIVEISIDSSVWMGRSWLYIIDNYLIACDQQIDDNGIHIFNKSNDVIVEIIK